MSVAKDDTLLVILGALVVTLEALVVTHGASVVGSTLAGCTLCSHSSTALQAPAGLQWHIINSCALSAVPIDHATTALEFRHFLLKWPIVRVIWDFLQV